MMSDMFKVSENDYSHSGRHLTLSEIVDDFIERNNFSAEERNAIRKAEYESKTTEEFWRKVEDILWTLLTPQEFWPPRKVVCKDKVRKSSRSIKSSTELIRTWQKNRKCVCTHWGLTRLLRQRDLPKSWKKSEFKRTLKIFQCPLDF